MGNGGYSQFITRCLCCSFLLKGRFLTLFPCSSMNVPLTGDSSPQTSLTWVLPTGCSPSGTGCSTMGPPRGHKPCQQTCSSVGSSLHGSAGPGRILLQRRLPTGSQPPSGIHLLQHGVPSTGCRWRSAPTLTSMDWKGTTCLGMVLVTSCK